MWRAHCPWQALLPWRGPQPVSSTTPCCPSCLDSHHCSAFPEKEPHVPTSGPLAPHFRSRRVFLSLGHEPVPELQERGGGSCFPRLCLPRGRGVLTAGENEALSTVPFVCLALVDYIFRHLQKVILNLYLVILLTLLYIFFFTSLLCRKAPPRFYIYHCVCVCASVVSAWYVCELKTFSSPLVPGHLTLMGLEMTNVTQTWVTVPRNARLIHPF